MKCEYEGCCFDCEGEVEMRGAMTAYHFEGVPNSPEDPNRDRPMCEAHWQNYHDHWKAMWDEYYSGIL